MQTRLEIILETVSYILENQRLGKKKRKDSPEGEPAGVKVHYKNVENASERLSAAHRELHDAKKEGDAKSKHFREVEQARAALRRSHRRLQSAKGAKKDAKKKKRYPDTDPHGGVRRVRPGHGDLEQG